MNKMKQILLFLIVSALSLSTFTACAKSEQIIEDVDPNTLTITFFGKDGGLLDIIALYESETGITLNAIYYEDDEDIAIVETKLMAGDKDVDIFCVNDVAIPPAYQVGAYVNLFDYDGIRERIESNKLVEKVSTYNGVCYSIPYDIYYSSHDRFIHPTIKDSAVEQIMIQKNATSNVQRSYMYENVSPMDCTFADTDAEELFEVLKWLYNHPDDPAENDVYSNPFSIITSSHLIVNTNSSKKELAADFLCYAFDIQSGAKEPADREFDRKYIQLDFDRLEKAYLDCRALREQRIIPVTVEEILATDGSNEAIRKLAEKTAKEIRKHIEG